MNSAISSFYCSNYTGEREVDAVTRRKFFSNGHDNGEDKAILKSWSRM